MFSINENEYALMTDEKLIENIKQEDQIALNCLIERYNDLVNMKEEIYLTKPEEEFKKIAENILDENLDIQAI